MNSTVKITESHEEIASMIVTAQEYWSEVSRQQHQHAEGITTHQGQGIGGTVEVYLCKDGTTDYYRVDTSNSTPDDYQAAILTINEALTGEDGDVLDDGSFSVDFFNSLVGHYTQQVSEILLRAGL